MNFDPTIFSIIVSIFGSTIYSVWSLGKKIAQIEQRLHDHVSTVDKINQLEKANMEQRLLKIERHIHDLRNQIQTLLLK